MSQHWRCTAEPEKHGVWPKEKLAHVFYGKPDGKDISAACRLACPLCLIEHKAGWVVPAVKP